MNSASRQIKQFIFVNLPDGCAMGTLHVISQNLKLWFRIHARLVRQEEILVCLHGIGLLRIVTNEDLAVKNCPRLTIKNAFIKLMAGAMRLPMIDN